MNKTIPTDQLINFFSKLSELISTIGLSSMTKSVYSSELNDDLIDENPLLFFPFEIRENITTVFYQPGFTSLAQQFIENTLLSDNDSKRLQELMNSLFHYSVRKGSHILSNNTIVILSQLPYEYLGRWGDMLALSATRSKYLDVVELGIRCFENWGNESSCAFLKECHFEEKWLQEYADEVCTSLEERQVKNVLLEKNIPREMANGEPDSSSNVGGYSSRYSSVGTEDR